MSDLYYQFIEPHDSQDANQAVVNAVNDLCQKAAAEVLAKRKDHLEFAAAEALNQAVQRGFVSAELAHAGPVANAVERVFRYHIMRLVLYGTSNLRESFTRLDDTQDGYGYDEMKKAFDAMKGIPD